MKVVENVEVNWNPILYAPSADVPHRKYAVSVG